ncbi:hypothetical protein HQ81_0180 [Dickeya phage phiDP23.1]|uniref:Uncharacterized protein n=16 Tax=Aglimvirinae TaxID=2169530 RepID=I0J2M8_9CAUD|nr:hypothetical protein G379_gp200 [Dickeya phage vB-DsoM-LIMEstone1]YP_009103006.1 hypothetical protein DA66_0167 [Dickeya phage RC-2014]AIM51464.1 hypothetical protein HQ80_0009 [Dickeya phage phiD3]AIM51647.1 hypothetical protein HQ82_0052 [Dickeya phage phiDP10.3]AIM51807.1 hypothetical protein HQ81_0180 [Dickeya phage phiDP23.1]ASD51191.1 hypothetical protein [Dickeya phage JA15]ASD51390.1 hypothetical protein [Dickeya phage XF4]ATW62010.1 putative transcription regulation protein [Dick
MAKKPEIKKVETPAPAPVDVIQAKEEGVLPSYLQRAVDNMPVGGDNGVVYAGGYGWVCEYQDGTKELLQELPGLAGTLKRYGRDKYGKPFEKGAVISTNITVETLNLLGVDDLKLLAAPLGITVEDRITLIAQLIEKLQIK